MSPSTALKELENNLDMLCSNLLNFAARQDTDYTAEELLKCRAFIAFAHAEFEHYLESISLLILNSEVQKWTKTKEIGLVGAAVLAFRGEKKAAVPEDPHNRGENSTLATLIMKAFSVQRGVIAGNNGIKPNNLSHMFTPLGVDEFDNELTIKLGNTGKLRGALVHRSSPNSITQLRDPFEEKAEIFDLLNELKKFEQALFENSTYVV